MNSSAHTTSSATTIDIGIAEADRLAIAEGVGRVLADTYTLYLKTHNYHWNVTGPMFNTLHLMFEAQYNEMWIAVDLLAERIRSLGVFAPGSYAQFAELTVDRRGRAGSRCRSDDRRPRARPRGGDPHRTVRLRPGRRSARRVDRRPADPTAPGPREDGLDAALDVGATVPEQLGVGCSGCAPSGSVVRSTLRPRRCGGCSSTLIGGRPGARAFAPPR